MKNIILILLSIIPLLSGGQDAIINTDTIYKHYRIKFIGSNKPGEITMVFRSFPQKKTVITDKLLFEYETDCLNDSSYTLVEKFVPTHTQGTAFSGGRIQFGYMEYSYKRIHKQPTFPDFIKWLHKKTEQW